MKQQFTQFGGARPFGASLMIAGIKDKKPELYTSTITGNYFSYYANAIGENDEKIKEKLREKCRPDANIKKGAKIALEIFKEVHGKNFDLDRFELVYIKNIEGKLKRVVKDEFDEFIK